MEDFKQFKAWVQNVASLSDDDCNAFMNYLTNKRIKKKQCFLTEGQICKDIGFINSGSFRVYYLSGGKEINIHFSFENEFAVDYDSFFQEKPSRYFIQALEDSVITTFSLHTLQEAYNRSQNCERFGRQMAEYSYTTISKRLESFLFMNSEERYLDLLKTEPRIVNRVPLYHIASYLGLERESLSRLRRKIAFK